MIDFFNNINLIRKNWTPSKKWESDLRANEEKDKVLIKKYPPNQKEKNYAKLYGKTIINVIDKLDQQSINKSTDALIAINTLFSIPTLLAPIIGGLGGYFFSNKSKSLQNQKKINAFNGAMIASGIYFVISQYIRSQLEKETTRIARYQAREKEFKDLSNFVIQEKEKINFNLQESFILEKQEKISDFNTIKTYKNAFKTLNEIKKDYKEYLKWRKIFQIKENENKKNNEKIFFTEVELSKAQKSRNKIINTIYKLELAANNEEINFQFALDLIQYAAKMSGAVLATLLCFLIPKNTNKITATSNILKNSKLLIPFTIPVLSLYLTAILAKIQKDSAKLGRFEKKKELINNEENYITFEDLKRNEINLLSKNFKEKNILKNLINDIKSIKTMPKRLKDMYSEIENFKIENNKQKDFITEMQKQEAEILQKQLFYTFEKIDEKSESFSDDIDVVLKTLKMGIGTTVNVGFNIYMLNLLTKKLKNFNGQKMPGFFEGLKLMKHLGRKDMINIFVLPYVIKSTLCIVLDTLSAVCRKKTNKIGVMTAINELQDERLYTSEFLKNTI